MNSQQQRFSPQRSSLPPVEVVELGQRKNFAEWWTPFMKWLGKASLYIAFGGLAGLIIALSGLYCQFAGSVC